MSFPEIKRAKVFPLYVSDEPRMERNGIWEENLTDERLSRAKRAKAFIKKLKCKKGIVYCAKCSDCIVADALHDDMEADSK